MNKLTLYTDGASRGNPGQSGIGIVLLNDGKETILEAKEYIGLKTNNQAEYLALIYGLEIALSKTDKVKVVSDSELLVNQVNGKYRIKQDHLKSLYNRLRELIVQFREFEIEHAQRELNKEADELANQAIEEFDEGKREVKDLKIESQEKLF